MSAFCRIGIHDYVHSETRPVIAKPRGPYDPRSDEDRTAVISFEVCTRCGKEREEQFDPYPCY